MWLVPLKRANQARTHHSIFCRRKNGTWRDITWTSEGCLSTKPKNTKWAAVNNAE